VGDAGYCCLKEGISNVNAIWITEGLSIDPGPNEEIVGLEELSAARHLGLSRDAKQVSIGRMPQ